MADENLIDYNGRWESRSYILDDYLKFTLGSNKTEVSLRPLTGQGLEDLRRIALKTRLAKGSRVRFRASVSTSGEIDIAYVGVRSGATSFDYTSARYPVSSEIRANQQMEFGNSWQSRSVERLFTIVENEVEYFVVGLLGKAGASSAFLNLSKFEMILVDSPTTFTLSVSTDSGYRRARFQNVQHQSAFEHALQVTATDTKTNAPATSGDVTFAVTTGPGGAYFNTNSAGTWNAVSGKAVVLDTVPIAGGKATAHTPWGYLRSTSDEWEIVTIDAVPGKQTSLQDVNAQVAKGQFARFQARVWKAASAHLLKEKGDGQSRQPGEMFDPLQVKVVDSRSYAIPDLWVEFVISGPAEFVAATQRDDMEWKSSTDVWVKTDTQGMVISPALHAGTSNGAVIVTAYGEACVQEVRFSLMVGLDSSQIKLSASTSSGYRRARFQNVQHQSAFEHALQVTATDTKTNLPATSGEVTFAMTSGPGGAYFDTNSASAWNAVSGKAVVLDTVPIAGGTATAHTPWGYLRATSDEWEIVTIDAVPDKQTSLQDVNAQVAKGRFARFQARVWKTASAHLLKEKGDGQSRQPGEAFDPLQVKVVDGHSNAVPDLWVEFLISGPAEFRAATQQDDMDWRSSTHVWVKTNTQGIAICPELHAGTSNGAVTVTAYGEASATVDEIRFSLMVARLEYQIKLTDPATTPVQLAVNSDRSITVQVTTLTGGAPVGGKTVNFSLDDASHTGVVFNGGSTSTSAVTGASTGNATVSVLGAKSIGQATLTIAMDGASPIKVPISVMQQVTRRSVDFILPPSATTPGSPFTGPIKVGVLRQTETGLQVVDPGVKVTFTIRTQSDKDAPYFVNGINHLHTDTQATDQEGQASSSSLHAGVDGGQYTVEIVVENAAPKSTELVVLSIDHFEPKDQSVKEAMRGLVTNSLYVMALDKDSNGNFQASCRLNE